MEIKLDSHYTIVGGRNGGKNQLESQRGGNGET